MEMYTYINPLGRSKSIFADGYVWNSNCHDQPHMEYNPIFLDGTSTVEGTCRLCGRRSSMYLICSHKCEGTKLKRFSLVQNLVKKLGDGHDCN
jgi:hypothetical protein